MSRRVVVFMTMGDVYSGEGSSDVSSKIYGGRYSEVYLGVSGLPVIGFDKKSGRDI